VPVGTTARRVALGYSPDRVAKPDSVFVAEWIRGPLPAFAKGLALTEQADDAAVRAFVADLPVAEAFSREEVSPADRAHRHRVTILRTEPDGGTYSYRKKP
jgi:hypothetical protein